jgi:hypothetical protein
MKCLIATLFFVILFTGCTVNDGTTTDSLKKLNGFNSIKSKAENIDSDWKRLVENSKLIVIGKVEETFYVVDEKKLYDKKSSSNELQLPNLREAVKGILIRFRINEFIYGEKKYKAYESVNIYVKDGYAPPMDSDIPTFASDKRYLVFLSPAVEEDVVEGTTVIQPRNLSKAIFSFDYKTAFTVTEKSFGRFQLTESNKPVEALKEFLEERN